MRNVAPYPSSLLSVSSPAWAPTAQRAPAFLIHPRGSESAGDHSISLRIFFEIAWPLRRLARALFARGHSPRSLPPARQSETPATELPRIRPVRAATFLRCRQPVTTPDSLRCDKRCWLLERAHRSGGAPWLVNHLSSPRLCLGDLPAKRFRGGSFDKEGCLPMTGLQCSVQLSARRRLCDSNEETPARWALSRAILRWFPHPPAGCCQSPRANSGTRREKPLLRTTLKGPLERACTISRGACGRFAARASLFLPEHEAHTANRVDQLPIKVVVYLAPKPVDVNVDDIVE